MGRKLAAVAALVSLLIIGTPAAGADEVVVATGPANWTGPLFDAACSTASSGLGVRGNVFGATVDLDLAVTRSTTDLSLTLTPSSCAAPASGMGTVSGLVRFLGPEWWQGSATGTYTRLGEVVILRLTVQAVEYSYATGQPTGYQANVAMEAQVVKDASTVGRGVVSHTSDFG